MKVMTVIGTRPELIRLSRIIPLLDQYTEHTLVHTGQNSDPRLKDVFFDELMIRSPDETASYISTHEIMQFVSNAIRKTEPDKMLILGDTNSGLAAALAADKSDVPVYHMEAGNRCYDNKVPEESNRRIIDRESTVLLPYTEHSRMNLLREGMPPNRIFVTGNPIYEVIRYYTLGLKIPELIINGTIQPKKYFLVTLHRAETLGDRNVLNHILTALYTLQVQMKMPVVISVHPHLKDVVNRYNFSLEMLMPFEPFGFREFINLERSAACVLTDSGTVQEECAILNVPCVILRDVTERPETIEVGGGIIAGRNPDVVNCVSAVMDTERSVMPRGYDRLNVSDTVLKIILSRVPP